MGAGKHAKLSDLACFARDSFLFSPFRRIVWPGMVKKLLTKEQDDYKLMEMVK